MDGRTLFPIAPTQEAAEVAADPQSSSSSKKPLEWLSNPSFSENLLPVIASSILQQYSTAVIEDEKPSTESPARHESVPSSPDDDFDRQLDEEYERRREQSGSKKKRKRRRRSKKADEGRRIGVLEGILGSRSVHLKGKEYYFDTHGDHDNITYGSLYRMDIARFYRHQTRLKTTEDGKMSSAFGSTYAEEDDVTINEHVKLEGRYWAPKYAALERRKDFKRLRLILRSSKPKSMGPFLASYDNFISVDDLDVQPEDAIGERILKEESWDDFMIRKTREFNQLTRERPHDESLWIAFAKFQDDVVNESSRKIAVQQALEKKVAVLEKALEHHPSSEDLLVMLMDTCRRKDPAPTVTAKWESLIKCNLGSFKLWKEYLHFRRGEFSLFTVSSLRKLHIYAIQAFSTLHKDDLKGESLMDDNIKVEKELLSLFVDLCRFEWQTGHHELAVGLFQAQLEYNMLSPPIQVSEAYKKRLFKEFWDSGAPRIGEEGATGWATWLQKEEEQMRSAVIENDDTDGDLGGWTGWMDLVPKTENAEESSATIVDGNTNIENDDTDAEELGKMEDEGMLLERLGLSLGPGQEVEVKDASTWRHWSIEEQKRDMSQWLPLRPAKLYHDSEMLQEADDADDEQLQRAVLFEDIREALFTLETSEARYELICHLVDFCTGPYPQWCCSNSLNWKERMESLESLFGTVLKEVQVASSSDVVSTFLNDHVGGVAWIDEDVQRPIFLSNILLLMRPIFSHSYWFQEKLLATEKSKVPSGDGKSESHGARSLAKRLLKNDRQAVLLWAAYGKLEGACGNIDVARKIFDTTLGSLSSFSEDLKAQAPKLYWCYVKTELLQPSASSSTRISIRERVLHILSFLGCGAPYVATASFSTMQILKAKHGFGQLVLDARKKRIQGDMSDQLRALMQCAILFELLVDGSEAAHLVFEEGVGISLPGRRLESIQFEMLHAAYVDMLEQERQFVMPSIIRNTIEHALSQYPSNLQLLNAYIRTFSCSMCTNAIRCHFDKALQRAPSIMLWIFAISVELRKVGSEHRIHSLFERALENVNMQQSVLLWRFYLAYELSVTQNNDAARRVFFRAIHACPWSKMLWLDGFQKMSSLLTAKELSELQDIIRDKELRLRTDVYEILLEEEDMDGLS